MLAMLSILDHFKFPFQHSVRCGPCTGVDCSDAVKTGVALLIRRGVQSGLYTRLLKLPVLDPSTPKNHV